MSSMLSPNSINDPLLPALVPITTAATRFAPAGRDTAAEFHHKAAIVERQTLLRHALDAMPDMVAILNGHRQIVAANQTFTKALDATVAELVEKRPGEVVGCIHAKEGPDGCGTALHCATCGAVNAIMDSMKTAEKVVRECRILAQTPSGVAPLDLRVTATPFQVEGERFTIAAITDISHEKRVAVLQRTFFHDVLNTAGCIQGYADYLTSDETLNEEICHRLSTLSRQLIEEIQSQRDLLHAESGELRTQPVPCSIGQVLDALRDQYLKHPAAENRHIVIDATWKGTILADRQLLQRVLGNMVKNALEATAPGGAVTLSSIESGEDVLFMVNNPEVMPDAVQLQVFQRSFSTKGQPGRGIGTYSMKLFGERYLGGQVDFVSHAPKGTTFRLFLPKQPAAGY